MDFDKSFLVPYYEYLYTIIPYTELHTTRSKLKPTKRNFKGYYECVFYMIDECDLSMSRTEYSEEMDKRVIINFYKANVMDETIVNEIPPHLKIRVNQYQIPLSDYLPCDAYRNTGRRFPRSIDITDPVFLNKTRENQCIINWDGDVLIGKYYFVLHLVRMRTTKELCTELMTNSIYPFENTQTKFLETVPNQKKNSFTSLICPISLIRMNIPVRGEHCNHLQCFDLVTYLTINFQKPNWRCPICDVKTVYSNLKIDNLIFGILNDPRSNSTTTEIIFNEHGQWKSGQKSKSVFNDVPKSIKRKSRDEEKSETAAKKWCDIIINELDSPNSQNESNLSNSLYEYNDNQPKIVYDIPCIQKNISTPAIHNDKNSSTINPYSMVFDSIPKTSTSVVENFLNCHPGTFEKDKDQISTQPKSVTSQSSNDQSDSKSATENFRWIPDTKIEYKLIKKDLLFYSELECYIAKENKATLVFAKPEDIPNNVKGEATEKRKLVILKMGQNSKIKISLFNPKSGDIEIHAARKPIDVYIELEKENVNYQITLEAFSSINFICHDQWEDRISLTFIDPEKSVAAFELFEMEDHLINNSNEYHEDYFNIIESICVENKSFLNRTLNLSEIRRKIRFLEVKSVIGKYCLRYLPVAVVVLDYDGNELFREIVTPRGMVKAYRQDVHGLLESNIIGNVDEEECTKALRTLLYDTIVVGVKVSSALFCLRIPLENVLGIRELSTGLCFDKFQVVNAFRSFWTLKCLAKKVINKEIQVGTGFYLCKENVNAIRDIYLAVEHQWVDHIHPDGTQELNLDCNSLEKINAQKNKIIETGQIDNPLSMPSDNDLGDVPDIELMEEDDIDYFDVVSRESSCHNDEISEHLLDESNCEEDSENHLSEGELIQFKENDCNNVLIEKCQDNSISLIDNTEHPKEFNLHIQDDVDNIDDSGIQTNVDRTSIDFESNEEISIRNDETLNEVSSIAIDCCLNHNSSISCEENPKNISVLIDNKEQAINNLSINANNDSIISIDFPIISVETSSINENVDNSITSIIDKEKRKEVLIDIENCLGTITTPIEIIPQNSTNETILLNNENINNSDKVNSLIDFDETSNVILSNNNENNKSAIFIDLENSANDISINEQELVKIDNDLIISLDSEEINKGNIFDKDISVNNIEIVPKSTNCDEISVNNIENSINIYDTEENDKIISSSNIDRCNNDVGSEYVSLDCKETESTNKLSIGQYPKDSDDLMNIDEEHNQDNVNCVSKSIPDSISNQFSDLQKPKITENGYSITPEENKISKSNENCVNGDNRIENISENQYMEIENYSSDDNYSNDTYFTSAICDESEIDNLKNKDDNKSNISDKSILLENLELPEEEKIIVSDENNFESKLQMSEYPWRNLFTKDMNIADIKTIVFNKNEMANTVKMKNENGGVNYLVKGIFYCPSTDTWTNVELDKESILELKQSTNKLDECKNIGSIDLTYDSN